MRKKKIYINNDVTKNRCCYLFLFQQRKIHWFFKASKNYEITTNIDDANYIIVISCVVAGKFKKMTIQRLSEYSEKHPEKIIICYGCFSHLEEEIAKINKIFPWVLFIDNDYINKFNDIFTDSCLPTFSKVIEDETAQFENNFDEKNGWITIGHWCLWNCYYCNHKLTKKLKSKPIGIIKYELKKRLTQWINHFRFISDDVASYGHDFNPKISFLDLLNELMQVDKKFSFSLWPIYPKILLNHTQEVIDMIESGRATELFVAIEHMSPNVLKKMNRYYDIEKLLEFIHELKVRFPEVKVSTHILYGFPGETKKDFIKIFKVMDYFDQVQFFEMWYNEYLRMNVKDVQENPKEIELKKKTIIQYYENKPGFFTHFDNRVVVLKNNPEITHETINYHTF